MSGSHPLPPRLQSILDDLALFPDRQERIDYLIGLANEYTPADVPRNQQTRVPGCESEVYIDKQGVNFRFAVDNPQGISAMALAAILGSALNGEETDFIQQVPDDVVYAIFGRELSMGKSLGLTGMVRMVKSLAAKS